MPFFAPWTAAPDFLGASEAGAGLNLTRQQMLERAQEHQEQLAASAALEHDRLSQQNAGLIAGQQQDNAANALKAAALKQQGILGTQKLQNESGSTNARDALEKAKTDAITKQQGITSNLKTIAIQAAAQLKAQNPAISNAEIISRFPMLENKDIPESPRAAPRSLKEALEFTPTMQNLIFKGALGSGGTNYDNAVDTLNRYRGQFQPQSDSAPTPDNSTPPTAADALTPPSPQPSQTLLPPLPESGRSNFSGGQMLGSSQPTPLPAGALMRFGSNETIGQPAAPSPAPDAAAPPITATNPKTGEKMILQNGKWQPIPQQ